MRHTEHSEPSLADDFSMIAQATTGILAVWVQSLDEARLKRLGELMGAGISPAVLVTPHGPHEACEGRVVLVDSNGVCQTAATIDFGLRRVLN